MKRFPDADKVDIFIPIYIGDYLKDTTFLTTEQHGAYILMLFACWQHGGIPNDDNVICRTTGLSLDAWSNAKAMLMRYFEDDSGMLVNRRIEKELMKARKNKNSAVERAKKAAQARWNKNDAPSMPQALPEDMLGLCPSTSPSTSPSELPKHTFKEKLLLLPAEAVEVCDLIIEHVRQINPKQKNISDSKIDKTRFSWASSIDKLNRIDGREWGEIFDVARWSLSDSFWGSNILSGAKLREKFDDLYIKKQSSKPNPIENDNNNEGSVLL